MKGGYETIPINQTGGGFSMNDTDCIRTKKQLKVGKKKKIMTVEDRFRRG